MSQLISNTTDWKKVHQAIDILRSLNKAFPEYVNQIVEEYGTHILKFLTCLRVHIYFIKERDHKKYISFDLRNIQEWKYCTFELKCC